MNNTDIKKDDLVVLMDGKVYLMASIAKVTADPTDKMVMLATYSKGKGFGNPSRRARSIILGKLDMKEGMSLDCICDMFEAAKKHEADTISSARSLFRSSINGVVA